MPVRHVTLTPNVVSTVTVAGIDADYVSVLHKANVTNVVWVTVNDVDPVANGDDCYYVPAGARRTVTRANQTGDSDVRLKSDGAVTVEVEFS